VIVGTVRRSQYGDPKATIRIDVRGARRAAITLLVVMAALVLSSNRMCAQNALALTSMTAPGMTEGCGGAPDGSVPPVRCDKLPALIVVGFMGGRVSAGNLLHKEALLAKDLQQRYPQTVHALMFANHDEGNALRAVVRLLDTQNDGHLNEQEKSAARIVIFGHSWGASETVNFARALDRLGIPVLLTIQVDSVEKLGEDGGSIPPNVREAINFYQTEGLLHGRRSIQAMDPTRTTVLGNYESSYKDNQVSCAGYRWYARAFMKPHIEIENDAAVWDRIEALIVAKSQGESR